MATLYKPREMAAAVAALDDTDAGSYQEQPYMALESGVLPESVFSDIASAIRGQNGESTLYQPGDMAAAILALEWDVGYKIRALLLDDGTLEINYYERRTSVIGGRIVQVFEIDPAGYSSCAFTTIDFRGFDPSTLTDLFYTFSGCSHLTTIYADASWALPTSGITGSQCFYSCNSLVGGNGTAWSSSNTGYTYMRIDRAGQAGYLTAA